ncbi:TonB-dependent receptor [Soonwooa sp.]|uniref:TonB-dependent receptor domain-containing protein n=1 Tax=Soonwooa sp. TaxID=1938592 RepID=UPI00261121D7|nr:TonB-dependent receptor [Soonwooa sp.]
MKKASILLVNLIGILTFGQKIEGKLTDNNNTSLSFVEIVASQKDKKYSSISSENGQFALQLPENGTYKLEIFKDQKSIFSEDVQVQGTIHKNIQMPSQPASEKQIEGVTVVATGKKLIERKVDRLVFNVENSVASQGVDAVEALSKTPMIRTTDDAISIAGKSSVAVMVNDRLLNLSGQELINYLKNLRSDDIAKIEVITTPPSKYAAEGKSGLINIVLKKNTSIGWNASLQTSGSVSKVANWRDGATFNYQGKKLSVSTSGSMGENIWTQKSHNYSVGEDQYWNSDGSYWGNYRYKNANIKTEYKLNDKNLIGFNYNYSFSNPYNISENHVRTLQNGVSSEFISNNLNHNNNNNHYATAFYDVKLDSLGSKLSFSGNLLSNKTALINNVKTFQNTEKEANNYNDNMYNVYSGQVDLEKNFSKLKTEAGIKYTNIKNDSDNQFFDIDNGQEQYNPLRSNAFLYHEKNYAAYFSTSFKIAEKWDGKFGLRYEYTKLDGTSKADNASVESSYGKFFPTAYVSYKADDNNTMSLNYSRRIRRPYFGNLNPSKTYTSDYEYYVGNQYLKPSFSDNVELSYVFKNNFTTTLYFTHTADSWDRIQKIENGNKFTTTENFYNENQTGMSVNYNFNKFRWLESNMFLTGFYNQATTTRTDVSLFPASFGANLNINNSFYLRKDKNFALTLGYWMDLPSKQGNSDINFSNNLYAGLKLNLLQKNLMINMNINDIFNTQAYRGREVYSNFTSNFKYKGLSQNVNLSVTYKFGNNNIKGATKQTKFEEQSRVGGGS